MTESLAAQWTRASTLLSAAPGFARAWGALLAEDLPPLPAGLTRRESIMATLRAMGEIGASLTVRRGDTDLDGRAWLRVEPDPVVTRAARAETDVRRRWRLAEGATYRAPESPDTAHRDLAIATWAGALLTRRRVNVPTLEAAPTLQQLADWLEHFSKALVDAQARAGMVRVPSVVGGMMDLRAGHGARPERSHGTFTAGDLQYWKLAMPAGEKRPALHMPIDGKAPTETGVVRDALGGGLLRAYLATWALTDGDQRGLFTLNVRRVTTEFYGLELKARTVNGKNYPRPPLTAEREFTRHFETLQNIYLEGIGTIEASHPQPLVSLYRDRETDRRVYQQAPLATLASKYFIQVPCEVLQLDSKDTPTALGFARLLRDHARDVLRGAGHYRATLQKLATMIGEAPRAKASKLGAATYYRTLTERLPRIVREGQLGELHLEGEGPNAVATLTPSSELATVYSSLAADRPTPTLEVLSEGMGRNHRRAKKAPKLPR